MKERQEISRDKNRPIHKDRDRERERERDSKTIVCCPSPLASSKVARCSSDAS
jgi:hypothetical protein